MNTDANHRMLTTRLPAPLLAKLERERFVRSEASGKRVSLRCLVQDALESLLDGSTEKGAGR